MSFVVDVFGAAVLSPLSGVGATFVGRHLGHSWFLSAAADFASKIVKTSGFSCEY